MRHPLRSSAALLAVLLAACTASAPDAAFTPVPGTGCPDLTGTFDLAGTALARAIAGRQAPQAHGLPVLLTFKPGPSTIEGWWVVPRDRLVAFANDAARDAPKRYARWRSLVLQVHPPGSAWDPDKALADIVALGPPGPTYAQVIGRRCGDGWMMVGSDTLRTPGKDGEPREEEREIWLARDAAGALLARIDTYALRSYSIWAPATQYIRTSRDRAYQRIAPADPASAAPLVAADLPPDPLTAPRPRMACAEVPARVAAFSDRLNALLPPKAQVTRFSLNPVRQQDADGRCPFAVVDVEIAGANAYFLDRTVDWMRAEPAVDSVETLRFADGRRRDDARRFRVVLH